MTAPHNKPDSGWMGDRKRGAGMGRPSVKLPITSDKVFVTLQRVKLDSGGYDQGGAYWGSGQTLYRASPDGDPAGWYFRAPSRDAAKIIVRESVPSAKFAR